MIITFLSDFGQNDGYVGAVKGVIKSIAPRVEIIDISHTIRPYDIASAGYALQNYYSTFPKGTTHLCVVDPGVGGIRRELIVASADYFFVGPDNGLFDSIIREQQVKCYMINPKPNSEVAATFHGRDIFGPVAAQLASGINVSQIAEPIEIVPKRQDRAGLLQGSQMKVKVLATDNFGNIIFDIHQDELRPYRVSKLSFKDIEFQEIFSYYEQIEMGKVLCLWNSQQRLEIAINGGNAARETYLNAETDYLTITVVKK